MIRQNDGVVFVGLGVVPVGVAAPTKEDADLFASLMKTPEGRQVLELLQTPGPTMGTWKIFKKIGKVIKQVGKITRPFTTALAKTFIPSGVVNALAKADPTSGAKLKNLLNKVVPAAQQVYSQAMIPAPAITTAPEPKKNTLRNILIVGGVAVAIVGGGALIMQKKRTVQAVPGV
jgi:hypothetical protein